MNVVDLCRMKAVNVCWAVSESHPIPPEGREERKGMPWCEPRQTAGQPSLLWQPFLYSRGVDRPHQRTSTDLPVQAVSLRSAQPGQPYLTRSQQSLQPRAATSKGGLIYRRGASRGLEDRHTFTYLSSSENCHLMQVAPRWSWRSLFLFFPAQGVLNRYLPSDKGDFGVVVDKCLWSCGSPFAVRSRLWQDFL